jgi:hypothetical protein
MPERDLIDLIREQLERVDSMGSLHADHEAFKQWHSETKTILRGFWGQVLFVAK